MKCSIKILFIDDSMNDILLMVHEIKKNGFNIEWKKVERESEMTIELENSKWDLIIIDYNIPNLNGISALKILKKKNLNVPIIMVSGMAENEKAAEAIKAGAKNYVIKGNYTQLVEVVKKYIKT